MREVSGEKASQTLSPIKCHPSGDNCPHPLLPGLHSLGFQGHTARHVAQKTHKPHHTFISGADTHMAAQFRQNSEKKKASKILTNLPHKQTVTHTRFLCSRPHLLRDSSIGGPEDGAVPKMAGASSYWSQGADVCQGLTHSSPLCPPTSCC